MTVDLALLLLMGVMFACGIYLLLERSLTRILLGIMLVNNAAVVLLFLASGGVGRAPLYESGVDPREYSDTLPQALILTAIVIGFATTAFLVAMIYRSWQLLRQDDVAADVEDLKVASQSWWDAEDDSVLTEEHSEFLDDAADPNAEYELATASAPRAQDAAKRPRPRHGRPAARAGSAAEGGDAGPASVLGAPAEGGDRP